MLPSLTIALLVAASPLVLSRNVFSRFPRPDGNTVTASWATSSALSSSVTNAAASEVKISEEGASTADSLAVRSTTPDMTLQTMSVATSAELTTDWIIVMNGAMTVPKFAVASTIVEPPMSAGDASTYSLSASSTEAQSASSAIPRTGTFSVSAYIPARPTSKSLSSASASSHKPPHDKPKPTVPSIPKPTFGGPRRPGLRTSPPFKVLQTNTSSTTLGPKPFRLWRTGPLFPWLRNSSDIYIPGSANSSATDIPEACPVWYMFRGARRCAGSAWGTQPSKNTTLSAAKPSIEVAGHKPSLRKPAFSKSSPSALATSSMASEASSAPNVAKPTPLGNNIGSRVVATNSLVRELDLHCPYVRGRPRCGGRLSRSRNPETTSTSASVTLAAPTGSAAIV